MNESPKKTEDLGKLDFGISPVWEYLDWDNTRITPVIDLPVVSLLNRIVGTQVQLGNGARKWAALSRISLGNPRRTREFLVAWVENNGEWFGLARYFDVDYNRRGPSQLSSFLGMCVEDVFPIEYDISSVAIGDPSVLVGTIRAEPEERLSEDERITLSLKDET